MTEQIARRVGRMLRRRELTLSLAESCTGGLIGRRITAVPGSSDYFLGGVIAYGNRAKEEILGVAKETLARYGAVSRPVASEMARGARRIFLADIALSATGIAGPSGGSRRKPVGLVYLGIAGPGGICVEKHIFKGERKAIQSQATDTALKMLADHLKLRDMSLPA